jgi:diguanylate cyclase (GGDEF)-like protein/PAS domain S-box-containing protein
VLNLLSAPVWIFDIEHSCMVWANTAALALWGAASVSELRERDLGADMGSTVKARLLNYLRTFRTGQHVRERWTFYPANQPRTVLCTCSGIELDDGRTAMLVEGSVDQAIDEDALRSLEAVRHTSLMISLYAQDGRLLSRNPAANLALADEERSLGDHFPSKQTAHDLLQCLQAQESCAAECQVVTVNGLRWHQLDARRSRDPVTGQYMIVISESDVSAKRQAESILREGEAVLRALLDASTEAAFLIGPDGCIITANETLAKRLETSLDQLRGRCIFDFFPSELAPARREAVAQVCQTGEPLNFVEVRADRHLHNTLQPVRDSNGIVTKIAVFSFDITELKRTEQALRKSGAFTRAVLDSVAAHIVIIDQQGKILETNRAWQEFACRNGLQGQPHCVGTNYLEVCDQVEGDDQEVARKAAAGIRSVLAGKLAEFVMDYACHSVDERRWFNLRAARMGYQGPVRVVISHENITNVKLAEQALKEREEALRRSEAIYRTIANNLPNGAVILFNKELRYTFIDGLGLRDHQLRREDLEGKLLWEIFSEDVCAPLTALYRSALDGATGAIEVFFGGAYFLVRAIPLRSTDGSVYGGLALTQDITTTKRLQQELEETNRRLLMLSGQDGLLGIANRRLFDETLSMECQRHARNHATLALLMIDVDHFKSYNDHYGHVRGDECLKRIAAILREAVCRPADLVARYGGEEFVVLLSDTDEKGAEDVAARIHARLAELALPHSSSPLGEVVTVSIGAAEQRPGQSNGSQALLAAADAALYQAKRGGRNRTERNIA